MTGARIISSRRRRMREVPHKPPHDNFMSEFLRDKSLLANIRDIEVRLAEARARGEK